LAERERQYVTAVMDTFTPVVETVATLLMLHCLESRLKIVSDG